MSNNRNPSGWLPLVGPFTVQNDGVALPRRGTINYVASTESGGAEDDPDNDRTNVNVGSGGSTDGENLGTGAEVFKDKSGGNLRFRKLTRNAALAALSNVTIAQGANDIAISAGNPCRTAASRYAGSDIGAKINAAMVALVAIGGGVVEVEDGDYVQTTRVVIEEGCTVELGNGTISNSLTPTYTPLWLLKDNASIVGKGFGTVLMTPVLAPEEPFPFTVVVSDYNSWPGTGGPVGNKNILVADIQFVGNPASTAVGTQSAAVQFGNVQNATCERCLFKGVEGYGVFQASSSASGNHADGVWIRDCIFEDVTTQNTGVINCRNWAIVGCLFRPTASEVGPTLIDCEMNEEDDIIENGIVANNVFDVRSIGAPNPASALVQFIGAIAGAYTAAGRVKDCIISNNIVLSGDSDTSTFGYGINLAYCDTITIARNIVKWSGYSIHLGNCNSIVVDGNQVHPGGNASAPSIQVGNSFDCTILNNVVHDTTEGGWAIPTMAETGTSDYNLFVNNKLNFYPIAPGGSGGLDCKIDLLGQHSRVVNTYTGSTPTPTDAAVATNIAELGALPVPGTRHADAPPVALVGGRSAQADGGFSLWQYDPSSSASGNGVTVVEPDSATGDGRWLRAPQNIKLSTTDRNALSLTTADSGFTIWNTTTSALNYWDGNSWEAIGSGGSVSGDIAIDSAEIGAGAAASGLLRVGTTSGNAEILTVKYDGGSDYVFLQMNGGALLAGDLNFAAAWRGQTSFLYGASSSGIYKTSGAGYAILVDGTNITISAEARVLIEDGNTGLTGDAFTYSAKLNSNFTTTNATATDTGFAIPVKSGEAWDLEFTGTIQCSSTGGVKFAIDGPGGSTIEGWLDGTTSAVNTRTQMRLSAISTLSGTAISTVATTPAPVKIAVCFVAGADGTLKLQAASATGGQTTTIFAGSKVRARRLSGV